jgi:hypothetical protein
MKAPTLLNTVIWKIFITIKTFETVSNLLQQEDIYIEISGYDMEYTTEDGDVHEISDIY